jgi:hypothetical protein
MLIITVMGLVALTVILIVVGFWLMQQEQASRQPASRPTGLGPELPSATSRPAPPPDLQWKRPSGRVPWALTRRNASLTIVYGGGLLVTLPYVLYSLSRNATADRPDFSPIACICMLPFIVIPLLIVSTQVWALVKGVRDWQKVKALEARGQLSEGVLLDRWSGLWRGSEYCVAYYFELPWGNPGGGPLIRAEVNKEAHRTYRVGDSVRVRYLPDNPQVCRLEV